MKVASASSPSTCATPMSRRTNRTSTAVVAVSAAATMYGAAFPTLCSRPPITGPVTLELCQVSEERAMTRDSEAAGTAAAMSGLKDGEANPWAAPPAAARR